MTTSDLRQLLDELGGAFTSAHVTADDGTRLHHVRGGSGPLLVLVHGFPQDWFEWRRLLPRLARRYTVVAVDLRGVGGSDAPADGYDAATLGRDLAAVVRSVGAGSAHVVGHDVGGWAAYALARQHPELVRSLVVMETLLPGIEPPDAPTPDVPLWHIGFHLVPGLAEDLVGGREAIYFRHFLTTGTSTPDVVGDREIEHYARAYGDRAHLRAAFEVYRALPDDVAFFGSAAGPVDVPLLLVGGEQCFGPVMPALASHLRTHHGWSDVRAVVVAGGRHYLPEQCPDEIADLIERHAAG